MPLAAAPRLRGSAEPWQGNADERSGARSGHSLAAIHPDAPEPSAPAAGEPLPAQTAHSIGGLLGHDFSDVRIHVDSAAARTARAFHAQAVTMGRDIAFGRDAYAPETPRGRWLLIHELAHVVQQRGAATPAPEALSQVGESHAQDAAEREADRAADTALRGEPARVATTGPLQLAAKRTADDEVITTVKQSTVDPTRKMKTSSTGEARDSGTPVAVTFGTDGPITDERRPIVQAAASRAVRGQSEMCSRGVHQTL
jgi:hypothetical protein